jgi:hypothetical protein
MKTHRVLAVALALFVSAPAFAAGFIINNNDGPNEGFNDQTPRTSDIDGQQTTLGQDRLDCFAAAAQVWADYLDTTITIEVDAQFNGLGGTMNSAVLGVAGGTASFRDFTGAPLAAMWFIVAQANQHRGLDLNGGTAEITAQFNSDVDGPVVFGSASWYYGTDGNPDINEIDFFSTAMHELGHGLGFLTLMNLQSGALQNGFMDIYTNQLRQAGMVNLNYSQMTNGERQAANISDQVVWKGANVVAEQGGNEPMYAPNPVQPASSISHWNTTASPNLIMEPIATEPFTALTLEAEAFADLLWPLAADPLDPDNVFVDFDFSGVESGGTGNPFNSLAEAIAVANPDATINIAAGASSPETFTGGNVIDAAVTLVKNGAGTNPTIGDAGARFASPANSGKPRSGFVSAGDK